MSLELAPDAVAWLTARGARRVNTDDLVRAYDKPHALVVDTTDEAPRWVADALSWDVTLHGGSGIPVAWVSSSVQVGELVGTSSGRRGLVWENGSVTVSPSHFRKGVATAILAREHDVQLRWEVRQVQLLAKGDGRFVWPRLGFLPQQQGFLEEQYIDWASEQNPHYDPSGVPSLREMALEFLETLDEIPLYREVLP